MAPLRRDLTEPVEDCGATIAAVGSDLAHVRAAVQCSAFDRSTFTDERWHAMAAGRFHQLPDAPNLRRNR